MSIELRQTPEYCKYIDCLGWVTSRVNTRTTIFIKKIIPFIYVAKVQRFEGLFSLNDLKRGLKQRGMYFVYLEPNNITNFKYFINKLGFKKTTSTLVPSRTIRINLKKTKNELLKEMHYKTRYNIKKIPNFKFQISKSENIQKFADFWQRNALKRGMFLPLKKEINKIYESFGNKATIIVAEKDGNWLSAIMTLETEDSIYYMYAASTQTGNKLFAPTLLVWEAIKRGKKKGKTWLDFEGIYDERHPLKSWIGFSRFKKSFAGEEISYPGTLIKRIIV